MKRILLPLLFFVPLALGAITADELAALVAL